jgi:hypothetical protein
MQTSLDPAAVNMPFAGEGKRMCGCVASAMIGAPSGDPPHSGVKTRPLSPAAERGIAVA